MLPSISFPSLYVLSFKREEGIEVGGGGQGVQRQTERKRERGIEREKINRLTVCVF
jgi:hypothetical protein